MSTDTKNTDIFVIDEDGGNLTQLTNNSLPDDTPRWSPDGTKIAFVRLDGVKKSVWVVNADGSNQVQITYPDYNDHSPQWCPTK